MKLKNIAFFLIIIITNASALNNNYNINVLKKLETHKENVDKLILSDILTGTYYHATISQTDDSPLYTSDGSYINPNKIDSLRWCALSRDLLNVPIMANKDTNKKHWRGRYKYGDVLIVKAIKNTKGLYVEKIVGKWIVHDVMNQRYNKFIDFLVSEEYLKGGKWNNLEVCKIETIE